MNPQSIPPRTVSGTIVANSHAANPAPIVSPTAATPINTEAPFSANGTISPLTSLSPVSAPPMIHSKLYCDHARSKSKKASAALKLNDPELKTVRSHAELAQTANGVRMLAKNLTRATIQLDVRSIMVVTKAKDNLLVVLTRELVEWLLGQSRDIAVYVDKGLEKLARFNARELFDSLDKARRNLRFWDKQFATRNPELFDLVLTLGGDGTVLYVLNLFQRIVPPVILFALGSLGFLTNFQFEDFPKHMVQALERGVRANLRMRFTCRVHHADGRLVGEQQVLNELVVDRGPSPYVTNLELYGDGSLLTVAQADGLIIATPTGSTAYSLSAGGLLVHPGVSAISVTPICPHTLSFRPILLPDGMVLKVRVPPTSRLAAWASFDGKERLELKRGDYVTIRASPYPFPTVILSKTEYIDSVSRNLHWNVRDQQKPFTHLLSEKNKQLFEGGSGGAHGDTNGDAQFDIDYSDDDDELETADTEITGSEPSEVEYDDDRPCFAHPNAKITLDPH